MPEDSNPQNTTQGAGAAPAQTQTASATPASISRAPAPAGSTTPATATAQRRSDSPVVTGLLQRPTWILTVPVEDCKAADIEAQIRDELADSVPSDVKPKIEACIKAVVELAAAHPTGPAELEMLEAADGRLLVGVKHPRRTSGQVLVTLPTPAVLATAAKPS